MSHDGEPLRSQHEQQQIKQMDHQHNQSMAWVQEFCIYILP